jgi:hypothetical protein
MKESIEATETLAGNGPEDIKLTGNERRMLEIEWQRQGNITSKAGAESYLLMVLSIKNPRKRAIILFAMIGMKTIKGKLGFDINTKDETFRRKAFAIWDALTLNQNGFYGTPFTELGLLWDNIDDYDQARTDLAAKKVKAATKNTAKVALKKTLDLALAYINALAKDLPESSLEIISGACMVVIEKGGIRKRAVTVKKLNAVGEFKLGTMAAMIDGKRTNAIYYWQYGIMVDGKKVWFDLDETQVANTIAKGMSTTVMTWYRGRNKTTKGGMTPWYYDEND